MNRRFALVVVLVLAAGCAKRSVERASPSSTTGDRPVVPWVDRPAPAMIFPTEVTAPIRADARPCRARDLAFEEDGRNGATGHSVFGFKVVNSSRSPCLLSGYPTVVATEPGRLAITAKQGGFFPDPGPAANVVPGASGYLDLMTERDCPARYAATSGFPAAVYHHVTIHMSGGDAHLVVSLDVFCGLAVSRFGVVQPTPTTTPLPVASLVARMELPRSARAGGTLRYLVVLANPTAHDIVLSPCPSYIETSENLKLLYALNCDDVTTVAAGGEVRYAMRALLPTTLATGRMTLYWNLLVYPEVHADATLTII